MEIRGDILIGENVTMAKVRPKKTKLKSKRYIIIHGSKSNSLNETVDKLIDPENSVSMHLVIDRKGNIKQIHSFNKEVKHSDRTYYNNHLGVNKCSIGISLVNLGRVKGFDGTYLDQEANSIHPSCVVADKQPNEDTKYWHNFPIKQIEALAEVCNTLKLEYSQIADVLLHSEVVRKTQDPGPVFPLYEFKKLLNL